MSALPPRMADKLNAPLIRLLIGDITKLGLRKLPYGPLEQMQKDQSVPLLDIGTLKLIREKHCDVYDDIDRIENKTVFFKSGRKNEFDAIIAAIGYHKGFNQDLLQVDKSRFEDLQVSTWINKNILEKTDFIFAGSMFPRPVRSGKSVWMRKKLQKA